MVPTTSIGQAEPCFSVWRFSSRGTPAGKRFVTWGRTLGWSTSVYVDPIKESTHRSTPLRLTQPEKIMGNRLARVSRRFRFRVDVGDLSKTFMLTVVARFPLPSFSRKCLVHSFPVFVLTLALTVKLPGLRSGRLHLPGNACVCQAEPPRRTSFWSCRKKFKHYLKRFRMVPGWRSAIERCKQQVSRLPGISKRRFARRSIRR